MPFLVFVPSHSLGGPLRVVANAPLTGRRPRMPVVLSSSPRKSPARFSRAFTANRIAAKIDRRYGRPLVLAEGELSRPFERGAGAG